LMSRGDDKCRQKKRRSTVVPFYKRGIWKKGGQEGKTTLKFPPPGNYGKIELKGETKFS